MFTILNIKNNLQLQKRQEMQILLQKEILYKKTVNVKNIFKREREQKKKKTKEKNNNNN